MHPNLPTQLDFLSWCTGCRALLLNGSLLPGCRRLGRSQEPLGRGPFDTQWSLPHHPQLFYLKLQCIITRAFREDINGIAFFWLNPTFAKDQGGKVERS